jgi:flagellar basal-body rod modification protein FlgD
MSIVGLDQVGSNATQTSEPKTSAMGKNDFLQLLVTQLQNQDPLNPSDSTEFTAQLATFSSLEELQNINSTLESVSTSQSILTNSQAVDYIGKQIQAVGNRLYLQDGESEPAEFALAEDAARVYIKIYNEYGMFIRDLEFGSMSAGPQSVNWDGMDYQDQQAPDGSYIFETFSVDSEGNTVEATTFTAGRVEGVYYKYGTAFLVTANQEIPMGNVVQVYENE